MFFKKTRKDVKNQEVKLLRKCFFATSKKQSSRMKTFVTLFRFTGNKIIIGNVNIMFETIGDSVNKKNISRFVKMS